LGGKVTFTTRPRERLEEIYDREEEIKQLVELLKKNEWVALLGSRMSGKTSLAKAVSHSLDSRVVYVDLIKSKNLLDVLTGIYQAMPLDVISRIKENFSFIELGPVKVKIKQKITPKIEELIKSLCDKRTILILDEIQDIKSGINHLIPVFHRLLNTCPNLSIIFTGSEIGLMKTLLEQKGEQPLAGRNPVKITLKPWDYETAKEYLKLGLEECGVAYSDKEIQGALSILGTLVGWLNFYGVNRCVKPHEDALKESLEEAISIALSELKNAADKKWKIKALKLMSTGATWSELLEKSRVSTETLSNFLDKLERLYIIEKVEKNYVISDPVYKRAALRL